MDVIVNGQYINVYHANIYIYIYIYGSFATKISQFNIWHFELLVYKETFADALLTGIVS